MNGDRLPERESLFDIIMPSSSKLLEPRTRDKLDASAHGIIAAYFHRLPQPPVKPPARLLGLETNVGAVRRQKSSVAEQ